MESKEAQFTSPVVRKPRSKGFIFLVSFLLFFVAAIVVLYIVGSTITQP